MLWAYEDGGNKEIYWLNNSTGEPRGKMMVGDITETEFALKGNVLLTSEGDIYDLTSEKNPVIYRHLDFPQK